ncbi:MAG: hypothetical protein OXP08_07610, partial [bacterium]|nr:hypothetical protein [bacterium]
MSSSPPMASHAHNSDAPVEAALVLADGTAFEGEMIGAPLDPRGGAASGGIASGEVVFNTVMTG